MVKTAIFLKYKNIIQEITIERGDILFIGNGKVGLIFKLLSISYSHNGKD